MSRAWVVVLGCAFALGCAPTKRKIPTLIQAVRDSNGARMIDLLHQATTPMRAPEAADGGRVSLHLDTRPEHYIWLMHNDSTLHALQEVCIETLGRRDWRDPNRWSPALATHIWTNPSYTEFRIEIDPDAMWHVPEWYIGRNSERAWMRAPRPVTAQDFALSLEVLRSKATGMAHIKTQYQDVKDVEVLGPKTLRVRYARSTYAALQGLVFLVPTPVWLYGSERDGTKIPRSEIPERLATHWARPIPVGAGPYELASIDARSMTMRRHERYHGERPALDEVRFLTPEDRISAHLLEKNVIDFSTVDVNSKRTFTTGRLSGLFASHIADTLGYYYIAWNTQDPRFSDARTRRALTMTLDRGRIVQHVFHDLAHIHDSPFAHGVSENAPELEPWPYDPTRAQTLLDAAGWTQRDPDGTRVKIVDGKRVRLEFSILTFDNPLYMFDFWVWKLKALGVKLKWKTLEWSRMKRALRERNYDVIMGGWSLSWDTDPYQIWHSSQVALEGSSNRARFSNPRADALLETLRVTFRHHKRVDLMRQFHRLIHAEQPYTILYATKELFVWHPRVRNVTFSPARPYYSPRTWHTKLKAPPGPK